MDVLPSNDTESVPKCNPKYLPSSLDEQTPLVIDNGSYMCRVGWAGSSSPELQFKNIIAKNRSNRKEKDWDIQIADEIVDIEAVRWLLRTPFDFNVVVNFSIQETILDYAFNKLSIDNDNCISHSILMTEPLANPSYCRKNMSELFFEAYNVPKLTYGIDCLFSQYFNTQTTADASLIISSGFQSTHIIPVIKGWPDVKNSLRINLGGYNCTAYMQRLLQLKHPHLLTHLTLTKMEEIIRNFCYIPIDYQQEVKNWCSVDFRLSKSTPISFSCPDLSKANSLSKLLRPTGASIQLYKEIKRAEHKLSEYECVLSYVEENPSTACKLCKDAGFDSLDELKKDSEHLHSSIKKLESQISSFTANVEKNDFTIMCGIEKIQVPEILFQPSLVGFDQAGIKECIKIVLDHYSADIQDAMSQNVFITGGTTNISGFKERVFAGLQELCPYESKVDVVQAGNSSIDAWKGAAKWATCDHQSWITKQEYNEFGSEIFKRHNYSN